MGFCTCGFLHLLQVLAGQVAQVGWARKACLRNWFATKSTTRVSFVKWIHILAKTRCFCVFVSFCVNICVYTCTWTHLIGFSYVCSCMSVCVCVHLNIIRVKMQMYTCIPCLQLHTLTYECDGNEEWGPFRYALLSTKKSVQIYQYLYDTYMYLYVCKYFLLSHHTHTHSHVLIAVRQQVKLHLKNAVRNVACFHSYLWRWFKTDWWEHMHTHAHNIHPYIWTYIHSCTQSCTCTAASQQVLWGGF